MVYKQVSNEYLAKNKEQFRDNFDIISGLIRSARNDPDAWEASIRTFEAQDHLDRLHPNRKGYQKWTAVIKPRLMADLF